MDKYLPWFKRMPELFKKIENDMGKMLFCLDEEQLVKNRVIFRGNSRVDGRGLIVCYPEGYPSFPPQVYGIKEEALLIRHQSPSTRQICCFGFGNERWQASFTAYDVIEEAENVIADYLDENAIPYNDIVAEPSVKYYEYTKNQRLLIAPPISDLPLDSFPQKFPAKLGLMSNGSCGAILSVNSTKGRIEANLVCQDWFQNSFPMNCKSLKLEAPPPRFKSYEELSRWLQYYDLTKELKPERILLFVFPDEWGKRGCYKPTWLALQINRKKTFNWIKCYSTSEEDVLVRNPYGTKLKDFTAMVVGCGSLGSHTAVALAQEGLGKLNLIDHDIFEPSNSMRHQVEQIGFGLPKTNALKKRINELIPNIQVIPQEFSVGSQWNDIDTYKFMNYLLESDIVVDTTGSHSVSRYLNALCVEYKKPLVVSSVTNGVWSAEIFRYVPEQTGCWLCWSLHYGDNVPPGAPTNEMEFAPGCDQPTFVGGVSEVMTASSLTVDMVIDTLLLRTNDYKAIGADYLLWHNRDLEGNRIYEVKKYPVVKHPDCWFCK